MQHLSRDVLKAKTENECDELHCFFRSAFQQAAEDLPVEAGSRVGFSSGRNITMADDLCVSEGRISASQNSNKLRKSFVLDVLVRGIVGALKLYTDRKIIALLAAAV